MSFELALGVVGLTLVVMGALLFVLAHVEERMFASVTTESDDAVSAVLDDEDGLDAAPAYSSAA